MGNMFKRQSEVHIDNEVSRYFARKYIAYNLYKTKRLKLDPSWGGKSPQKTSLLVDLNCHKKAMLIRKIQANSVRPHNIFLIFNIIIP